LRAELQELRDELRNELRAEFATKTELYAMKADLQATTEGLRTDMNTGFAEMRTYVDFSVKSVRDELRTHFDIVAESLRDDIRNMVRLDESQHQRCNEPYRRARNRSLAPVSPAWRRA